MAAAAAPYGALTLTAVKIGSLAANDVVVAVVDEFNRGRVYSPILKDGLAPQTGDALTSGCRTSAPSPRPLTRPAARPGHGR